MAEIRLLHPGLWVVETAVEDFEVRGAVVAGAERMVVFDTLVRPEDMIGVAELAQDLPLSVVYSHGDWDHVWGTEGLSRPLGEVLAHASCLPRFDRELPDTLAEKRAEAPDVYGHVELVAPTRTISTTTTLDLGGVSLELHPLPGHTPDTLVGFIPEWGTLLAGDAVEAPLPFLNEASPVASWVAGLEGWIETLGRWNREAPSRRATVIPSHGPVGGRELLVENVLYLRALLEGHTPKLPTDLSPFYVSTHAANLRIVGEL